MRRISIAEALDLREPTQRVRCIRPDAANAHRQPADAAMERGCVQFEHALQAMGVQAIAAVDTCPNYQRLYSPFRHGGARASVRKLTKGNLVLIETVGAANYGPTAPVSFVDAFNVQLSLMTCADTELFVDGKHLDGVDNSVRSVQIHDLRRSPVG